MAAAPSMVAFPDLLRGFHKTLSPFLRALSNMCAKPTLPAATHSWREQWRSHLLQALPLAGWTCLLCCPLCSRQVCVGVWWCGCGCKHVCVLAFVPACMNVCLPSCGQQMPHTASPTHNVQKRRGFSQMGGMQLRLTCYSPTISNGSPFLRMQVT